MYYERKRNKFDRASDIKKEPDIDFDSDGVMLWNGKRCEIIPPTEQECKEMEILLKNICKNEEN